MKLKVGKLYVCEEYYLMLYPDKKSAAIAAEAGTAPVHARVAADIAYWTRKFGKPVLYAELNMPLLILNVKEKYYEVLTGNKKGWIIFKDWLKIKELF